MKKETKKVNMDDVFEIINKSIKYGEGLISYRKHLEMLLTLEKRLERLVDYKKNLTKEIDKEINKLTDDYDTLRNNIKNAMEKDNSIEKTETGGKIVRLPDLGTMSLSKSMEKIKIIDPIKLLKFLGKEYERITITPDKTKARNFIKDNLKKKMPGVSIEKERELKIIKK